MREKRSTRGVLRSEVDVKSWATRTPSVSQVRPAQCPDCGAASAPVGGRVVVQGHGLRSRQLRGPPAPYAAPMVTEIQSRRYRCIACRAVLAVVPAEALTRRLYSAAAIAWSLALYGLSLLAPEAVRELVSPWRVMAASSAARWRTLSRWCASVAGGGLFTRLPPLTGATARQMAAAGATAISAYAAPRPEPPPLDVLAFHGAARAA